MPELEYVWYGHCSSCDNDEARLYRPKFTEGRVVVFTPICRKCCEAKILSELPPTEPSGSSSV